MSKSEKAKRKRLWDLFRITLEEHNAVEAYQKKHPLFNVLVGTWNGTDHDHETGLIRGRLDFRLNKLLGFVESVDKENAANILRALAEYIDHPPAVTVIGLRYGLIGKAQYKKKMVYGPPKGMSGSKQKKY